MDASDWVPVVTVAATAIVTTWQAYRFSLRQDDRRWARTQRAELYIDLLVEARAEADWALSQWTGLEIAEIGGPTAADHLESLYLLPDDRMPSRERKALGARMLAYASPEVSTLFREIGRHAPLLPMTRKTPAVEKPRIEEAFSNLEARVREELQDGSTRK